MLCKHDIRPVREIRSADANRPLSRTICSRGTHCSSTGWFRIFQGFRLTKQKKNLHVRARSRGGKGKLAVLGDAVLSTPIVMSLVFGTPCPLIIEELRALFHEFYLFVSYQTGTGTGGRGDIRKPEGNRPTDSVGTQQVPILRRNLGYCREALEHCLRCR